MSKINLISIDFKKAPDHCEVCNVKVEEADDLRPYGPQGKWICFDCGMKNQEETSKQFSKASNGTHSATVKAAIEIVKRIKKKP